MTTAAESAHRRGSRARLGLAILTGVVAILGAQQVAASSADRSNRSLATASVSLP